MMNLFVFISKTRIVNLIIIKAIGIAKHSITIGKYLK